MNYAEIKWTDIANGEGVRISLFVSGCTHNCKNCFNQIAWDFHYGHPFDEIIEEKILRELGKPYIAGLSLLGGEPLEPQNQEALLPFVKAVKKKYPEKDIWCYTGYTYEEILANPRLKTVLDYIDVLVDGRFEQALFSPYLEFRGSSNQRILRIGNK